MILSVALRLGRVSNLPTVWSNALAGFALGGAAPAPLAAAAVMAALSLLYVAGMFLNDACDHRIDARERPDRPIPAGQVTAAQAMTAGSGMMVAALVLLFGLAAGGQGGWLLPAAGSGLAAAILVYDLDHKGNPWSPVVMGWCRALVYLVAALAAAGTPDALLLPAMLALFAHTAGLTHAARHEAAGRPGRPWPLALLAVAALFALWLGALHPMALVPALAFVLWTAWAVLVLRGGGRGVPRGVAMLIAGMALLDATVATALAGPAWGVAAAAGFLLTVILQRRIPGT